MDTVGKKLAEARSAKGLSLDEAAYATKIRPDKLGALEQDDLSAFPNNTYARGFLLIYGRFLDVDVSELANQLQSGNPISVEDYQYLNVAPEQVREERSRMRPRETRPRRPSIAPLVVFIVLLIAAGFGLRLFLNLQRVGDLDKANGAMTLVEDGTSAATAESSTPVPQSATTAIIPSTAPGPTPIPPPATTQITPPRTSDREFLAPAASTTPAPAAQLTPRVGQFPTVNELAVDPAKNSWITIRRDDPKSAPIFDGLVYANAGTLKIKGAKLFVEVREGGAVNLRKNGEPLAYQAPGITVQ